ncbi:uncharacterized protein [Amphiura filiformis]|uniref:uncharacterized protein n=1 Tax=Amphiura filiformis TaxID=82378 RepID=UPI003B224E01
MPSFCCVKDCSNRWERDGGKQGVSFFRIPKILTKGGDIAVERSERRRRMWNSAISVDRKLNDNDRVCSRHFVSGMRAKDWEEFNVDWVPTLHMGHEKVKVTTEKAVKRDERKKQRAKRKSVIEAEHSEAKKQLKHDEASDVTVIVRQPQLQPSSTESESTEHDAEVVPIPKLKNMESQTDMTRKDMESQTDLTSKDIDTLLRHTINQDECIRKFQEQVELSNSVSQKRLEGDDNMVKYYTGLPTYSLLLAIFNLVSPFITVTHRSAMTKFQQLIIVFMRLRLNLSECDLAYRFDVAQSTISRTFHLTLDVLFTRLNHLIVWPEREQLRLTMPMQFREHFGVRVACIIDCFEIFIDRPSNLLARAQTWSNYKHHNTIKYLIGITPQGTISYLSNAWGGRTSDKHITENSGFLQKLDAGDIILADRGFNIAECVGMQSAEVLIPAFTKGKKQLTPAEVELTRKIAHVRIHRRSDALVMHEKKYRVLCGPIPIDYLERKDTNGWIAMDKIARTCCALTNLSDSVVAFD